MNVPPLKFESEIKNLIYSSLAEILKPLIDKWDAEIRRSTPDSAGLIAARNDVQDIIDNAHRRMN